jgi:hypothetical protein
MTNARVGPDMEREGTQLCFGGTSGRMLWAMDTSAQESLQPAPDTCRALRRTTRAHAAQHTHTTTLCARRVPSRRFSGVGACENGVQSPVLCFLRSTFVGGGKSSNRRRKRSERSRGSDQSHPPKKRKSKRGSKGVGETVIHVKLVRRWCVSWMFGCGLNGLCVVETRSLCCADAFVMTKGMSKSLKY